MKPTLRDKLRRLITLKMKFAMASGLATAVDYGVYIGLVHYFFSPVVSNIISYSCGMVINFLLQKRFIFSLQRTVSQAFALSMLVSLGGLLLSTAIIYLLNRITMLTNYQFIIKLIATGIVFFYNFYLKRFVFEKRFFANE
ncbi:MAG TPA: GtrA family protein [Saprospiraceae bacterium]|nr:GtrA family protein [Saprospiraceae bacterium]HMP22522.1 GtrA family protein [Saprospiraceae bacterium]